MKKILLKLISVITVLLVLCTAATGCAQQAVNGKKAPDEEKFDLKGYEVRIAGGDEWGGGAPQKTSVTFKEETNLIKKIEKKYSCKIKFMGFPGGWGESAQKFITGALSGDAAADVSGMGTDNFPAIAIKKLALPLDDYIDVKLKQWDKVTFGFSTYKGKHYLYSPAPELYILNGPCDGIFFNKRIFERDALPDLYELQKNKQWTWDKFKEIAKTATKDMNGDGKLDQWGYGGGFGFIGALPEILIASNGGSFTKTVNGKEVFAMTDPAVTEAYQFMYDLYNSDKVIDTNSNIDGDFMEGKVAMLSSQLYMALSFKPKMENDKFGFVFFPMGPRMKDYVTSNNGYNVFAFPVSAKHPKEVGRILTEYYAPYGWRQPTTSLYEPYFFDEQSVETCRLAEKRIVFNNFCPYPFIQNKIWGGFPAFLKGKLSAVGYMESVKQQAQKSIDDVWNTTK